MTGSLEFSSAVEVYVYTFQCFSFTFYSIAIVSVVSLTNMAFNVD